MAGAGLRSISSFLGLVYIVSHCPSLLSLRTYSYYPPQLRARLGFPARHPELCPIQQLAPNTCRSVLPLDMVLSLADAVVPKL